mmetsp:Transcript_4357/g.9795  ORF Transcript_4357/g.9795 Transcript_4357/m.9795 type:complete len:401 (+) Transcript_4357:358-1560(+)
MRRPRRHEGGRGEAVRQAEEPDARVGTRRRSRRRLPHALRGLLPPPDEAGRHDWLRRPVLRGEGVRDDQVDPVPRGAHERRAQGGAGDGQRGESAAVAHQHAALRPPAVVPERSHRGPQRPPAPGGDVRVPRGRVGEAPRGRVRASPLRRRPVRAAGDTEGGERRRRRGRGPVRAERSGGGWRDVHERRQGHREEALGGAAEGRRRGRERRRGELVGGGEQLGGGDGGEQRRGGRRRGPRRRRLHGHRRHGPHGHVLGPPLGRRQRRARRGGRPAQEPRGGDAPHRRGGAAPSALHGPPGDGRGAGRRRRLLERSRVRPPGRGGGDGPRRRGERAVQERRGRRGGEEGGQEGEGRRRRRRGRPRAEVQVLGWCAMRRPRKRRGCQAITLAFSRPVFVFGG